MKKYILLVLSLLVVAGLVFPPYKSYTSTLLWKTPDRYMSIWRLFKLRSGRISLSIPFLILLFPSWFIWDLFNNHISRSRFFYIIQGVICVSAGIFIWRLMSISLFQEDVVYFSNYYITPIWVLLSGFISIILFSKKIREKLKSKLFKNT